MKRLDSYSQHFLRGPEFIKELIGHSNVKPVDTVYDIGAGSGAISAVLASRAKKVFAVEFEPRILETLRRNMERYPNVKVVAADIIEMPLPSGAYKVFANIPFHLSSPIVRKLTEAKNPPKATYLIVQKQFAQKLLPDSDRFKAQLGMLIAPTFSVRIRRPLKRTDFTPPPAVDTVLLELLKRDQPLIPLEQMPAWRDFITNCFADPRVFAKTPQAAIGLAEGIKPSQLKLAQWLLLFNAARK